MAATPFDRYPGHTSGQMVPSTGPVGGAYSFVLGSDVPGQVFAFEVGDYTEASQAVDVTGLSRVTFAARLRGADTAGGASWRFSWLVDGVAQGSREVRQGMDVLFTDGAFDVSQLAGVHTLALRLEVAP